MRKYTYKSEGLGALGEGNGPLLVGGAVVVAAAIGFFVYQNKKKKDEEAAAAAAAALAKRQSSGTSTTYTEVYDSGAPGSRYVPDAGGVMNPTQVSWRDDLMSNQASAWREYGTV